MFEGRFIGSCILLSPSFQNTGGSKGILRRTSLTHHKTCISRAGCDSHAIAMPPARWRAPRRQQHNKSPNNIFCPVCTESSRSEKLISWAILLWIFKLLLPYILLFTKACGGVFVFLCGSGLVIELLVLAMEKGRRLGIQDI